MKVGRFFLLFVLVSFANDDLNLFHGEKRQINAMQPSVVDKSLFPPPFLSLFSRNLRARNCANPNVNISSSFPAEIFRISKYRRRQHNLGMKERQTAMHC